MDDPALIAEIGQDAYDKLMEEIELLDGASAEFDQELVTKGELSPVFFGSALTNFGVETFFAAFLKDDLLRRCRARRISEKLTRC